MVSQPTDSEISKQLVYILQYYIIIFIFLIELTCYISLMK